MVKPIPTDVKQNVTMLKLPATESAPAKDVRLIVRISYGQSAPRVVKPMPTDVKQHVPEMYVTVLESAHAKMELGAELG